MHFGIQNDRAITEIVNATKMIDPYAPSQVKEVDGLRAISFGQSSFGYDMRIADEFRIFSPATGSVTVIDPKNMDEKALVFHQGPTCVVPPNSFVLGRSVEYFKMPRNVLAICLGKSTYARCSIVVNVTPLEPGWEGFLTIEISNTSPLPAIIYANEGIAQLLFFMGETPLVSYADRKGKYQNQTDITLPIV